MGFRTSESGAMRSSTPRGRRLYASPNDFIASEDFVPAALDAFAEGVREAVAGDKSRAAKVASRTA